MENLLKFVAFAHELADAAAAQSLPLFRAGIAVENKQQSGGFDPVTEADRNAEQAMRQLIEQHYPDHAIMGEEFGIKKAAPAPAPAPSPDNRPSFQWVLDPIDGTRAFITGMPSWGTLIALSENAKPLLGLFDQPFTGERIIAMTGGDAVFSHHGTSRVLACRKCASLPEAILATTSHEFFVNAPGEQAFADIVKTAKLVRYGGDCYNYAMVAAGQIDAVIEQGLQAYDIQALIPIIKSAGGIVTNWRGEDASTACMHGGQVVAAGDAALHEILIARLSSEAI